MTLDISNQGLRIALWQMQQLVIGHKSTLSLTSKVLLRACIWTLLMHNRWPASNQD